MSLPSADGYPATGKIKASRTNNLEASTYVGPEGLIWYDVLTGVLRLGDGVTPGGILIGGGGGGNARPAGPITAIQFNADGNNMGGNASFTFDEANANVQLNGNIVVGNAGVGHFYAEAGIMLNGNVIQQSYTVGDPGYNALSAGPIQVPTGITVDVPTGQRWTIV